MPSPPPRPQTTPRQLPIRALSFWDRYPDIKEALHQLELGYFRRAAFLMDASMQDDRIYGVWQTRLNAITAAPVSVKPAKKTSKAIKYAEEIGGSDDEPGLWPEMVSHSALADMILWGKSLGVAIAYIDWTAGPRRSTPRLIPWHPQFVRFDWYEYTFKVLTAEGVEISMPRVDQTPRGDGQWFVYTPYGFYGGWLRGMIRWVAGKYVMRGWDYRDWARFNEIYGAPITAAYVPAGATADEKNGFFDDVRNRGGEATVLVPVADGETRENSKYGVGLIESKGRGTDTFKDFKETLDQDIAVGILGQNLTTQVSGSGSLAAAKQHTLVRMDVAKADAKIAEDIRAQVLTWDAQYNYGDPELAPRALISVEPPEDEGAEATNLKMFGDALTSIDTGSGGTVNIEAMIQEFGLPLRTPEEIAAIAEEKLKQQQEIARSMGAGNFGRAGPDDDGGGGAGGGQPQKKDEGDSTGSGDEEPKALRAAPAPAVKRYEFQGLPIAVENPAGSIRRWYDENAQETGQTTMRYDYGYIEGVLGNDKEELDVYVGPDPNAPDVHIVHQRKKPDYKGYDEDKTFLGFPDAGSAKAAFVQHRDDGDAAFGTMSTIPLDRFKAKLKRRTTGRKIHASAAGGLVALVIVKHGEEYFVYSEDRSRRLGGPYKTKGEAEARLRQVEYFKHHSTTAALVNLVARTRGLRALRTPRTVAGKKRAARYVDQLEKHAIAAAAGALAPDISALRGLIEKATDLRELQRAILATYRNKMSPDRLADVVRKASVLSNLAGRDTALQQT